MTKQSSRNSIKAIRQSFDRGKNKTTSMEKGKYPTIEKLLAMDWLELIVLGSFVYFMVFTAFRIVSAIVLMIIIAKRICPVVSPRLIKPIREVNAWVTLKEKRFYK